jgi:hypothetical protein
MYKNNAIKPMHSEVEEAKLAHWHVIRDTLKGVDKVNGEEIKLIQLTSDLTVLVQTVMGFYEMVIDGDSVVARPCVMTIEDIDLPVICTIYRDINLIGKNDRKSTAKEKIDTTEVNPATSLGSMLGGMFS